MGEKTHCAAISYYLHNVFRSQTVRDYIERQICTSTDPKIQDANLLYSYYKNVRSASGITAPIKKAPCKVYVHLTGSFSTGAVFFLPAEHMHCGLWLIVFTTYTHCGQTLKRQHHYYTHLYSISWQRLASPPRQQHSLQPLRQLLQSPIQLHVLKK